MTAYESTDVPVICNACGARLRIRQGQSGKVYPCPKCGGPVDLDQPTAPPVLDYLPLPATSSTRAGARGADDNEAVPSTPRNATKGVPYSGRDASEYKVLPGVDQPPPESPARKKYFAVVCPTCHTRMTTTEDQVGQLLKCPDCRRSVVVPPPPPPKPRRLWSEDDGVEVQYQPACEPPPVKVGPVHNPAILDVARAEAARREPPPVPRWPLVTGVFSFPCYSNVCVRWLGLSFWLAIVLALLQGFIAMMAVRSLGSWVVAVFVSLPLFVSGGVWWIVMSSPLLAVLEDTSEGVDRVENWPHSVWLCNSIRDPIFVLNAGLLSLLPGVAIDAALGRFVAVSWIAIPIGAVVLFPFILLSMLEVDSVFAPVSLPVWRSLRKARAAWFGMYLESAALWALVGIIAFCAWRNGSTLWLALGATAVVGWLFIYFRLLGRLGWICGERLAKESDADTHADADENVEEDDDIEEALAKRAIKAAKH
jgi:DNA-directed RNA polymerase subunit RPC12/RpoP